MSERASLCTMAQLKERCWTPALVKKFLGAPDATQPNPLYRSAAPMHPYAAARVEACEQDNSWQQAAGHKARRGERGL